VALLQTEWNLLFQGLVGIFLVSRETKRYLRAAKNICC